MLPFKRLRQNHALEHATVEVLLEKGRARPPLGGNSVPWGFLLYGRLNVADVEEASRQALERLRRGQRELAVSPYCGTNLVVGALLGVAAMTLVARRRRGRLPLALATAWLASRLGRPLGMTAQRLITTRADVSDLEIEAVHQLRLGPLSVQWVKTRTARPGE